MDMPGPFEDEARLEFEWDPRKAEINEHKHGVSFEEAAEAIASPLVRVAYDAGHSHVEDRWIAIGISPRMRMVLVVYTRHGNRVRIISARKPGSKEMAKYHETKDQG